MRLRLAQSAALAVVVAGCGGGSEPASRSGSAAPEWRALAPASLARTEVAAARVGRYVYVMGGFERDSGATTAATERYDIERDRWTRVADMPVALNHAAATSYKRRVYVLGGYRARTGLSREVATLTATTRGATAGRGCPRRRPAAAHSLSAWSANACTRSGEPTPRRERSRRWRSTTSAGRRWRTGPDMAVPREHLAAAVAGGRFYALAGRAAGQGNFTVVEAYNPRTRRWRREPAMRKARGGIAAATISGHIVVLGGEESAGTIREVELFDARERDWSRLPDLPTPRHGLGAVARDGHVYAIEGGDRPGFAFTNALEGLDLR